VRIATAVLTLFLVINGCSQPLPPPLPESSADHEDALPRPSDRTALLAELERRFDRWVREGPLAYELKVSRLCFCDPGIPWVSENRGPKVVSSRGGFLSDGRDIGPPLRTVWQLFAEAERAAESTAEEVTVWFDPTLHYPVRIHIDRERGSADDELTWVAELTVLR